MDVMYEDEELMDYYDQAVELVEKHAEGDDHYLAYVKAEREKVLDLTADFVMQIGLAPAEVFFDVVDDFASWVHLYDESSYILELLPSEWTDEADQALANLSLRSAQLITTLELDDEDDEFTQMTLTLADFLDEAQDLYDSCAHEDVSDEDSRHDVRDYLRDNIMRVQWMLSHAVGVIDGFHMAVGLNKEELKMFEELKDIMHNYQHLVYIEPEEIYDDDLDVLQSMIWLVGKILCEG